MIKRLAINNWMLGIMFALGLNLAGADGDWVPWINFVGILILSCVAFVAKLLDKKESNKKMT